MNLRHTSARQDEEIKSAIANEHISNLVSIIEDLDRKITEWEDAARIGGFDTPEEVKNFIESINPN